MGKYPFSLLESIYTMIVTIPRTVISSAFDFNPEVYFRLSMLVIFLSTYTNKP